MSFSHGDKFIPEYAIFSNRKSHDHDKQSLDQSDFRAMT